MSEENCLFCKIIDGRIPGEFVHQDDQCVVIRDINPQAPMHVLVIPREHLESLDDVAQKDEPLLGHLLRVGARVAIAHGDPASHGGAGLTTSRNACNHLPPVVSRRSRYSR